MIANAREAVQAEMRSVLNLAVALGGTARLSDAQAFNALGLRHLRVVEAGEPVPPSGPSAAGAPSWFVALIGVGIQDRILDRPGGPALRLIAEPDDEIAEVWEDMTGLALAMLVTGALLLAAAWVAVDRALRPLDRFAEAMDRLRAGTYEVRFDGGEVPELARLGAGIVALTRALAAAEAESRRLGHQLVAAQDTERREIARDLHDELGAALFGIKVDAGRILRLGDPAAAAGTAAAETVERARSILTTADTVHRLSRRILKRLRPAVLDQLPLGEALGELVGEWSRRQPGVRWTFDLRTDPDGEGLDGLDEALRITVYRLVQESLVNALRHARPSTVAVSVRVTEGEMAIRIADDGPGVDARAVGPETGSSGGFGISGMEERVRALGGQLVIGCGDLGGTEVCARLPVRRDRLAERAA
ncbi:histidine kinase [Azospirillum thermophilum]|uniref:histidine kinase n=2 Tax=Azospirillum thermophilum TaxID=2202148 RepID=A0A2S2CVV4_9PROT|nr:histidine kinase [Azospirillum thermophilum]